MTTEFIPTCKICQFNYVNGSASDDVDIEHLSSTELETLDKMKEKDINL